MSKQITDEFTLRFITELNLCRKNPQKYSSKLRSYEQYFDNEILRLPNETAIKTKEGYASFDEAAMFLDNLDEGDLVLVHALGRLSDGLGDIVVVEAVLVEHVAEPVR